MSLSSPRYGATAAVVGSKAYFAGSANGVSTVDVYDSASNSWSTLAMPYKLAAMSGTVIKNQIFYAGGYDPTTYAVSNVVQIYDTVTNTWSVANLSEARAMIATATFSDRAIFAGGATKVTYPATGSATVDVYWVTP
jgi:N-acetylneuraminic acid mutarotase